MVKIIIATLLCINLFSATLPSKQILEQQIGKMIIFGFEDSKLENNSPIINAIERYNLGGVILFDRFYEDRSRIKNIESPQQLQALTQKLKEISPQLLISIDQEGGKVQRLKESYGFDSTPSAFEMAKLSEEKAKESYENMAKMLKKSGINLNFAPVVDLALNPQNRVIYGLERSYGKTSDMVTAYASIFIDALEKEGVIAVLKHFPGHGSSLNDSHKGFVDVTQTWSEIELEPFKQLLEKNSVQMIMTAHIFNENLDKNYPATLSHNTNTKLLREKLGFKGVIISDDLQMKAISEHYSLKQTVTLAINSGVDLLLFGNQLAKQDLEELINTIYEEVSNENISYELILKANERIVALKKGV